MTVAPDERRLQQRFQELRRAEAAQAPAFAATLAAARRGAVAARRRRLRVAIALPVIASLAGALWLLHAPSPPGPEPPATRAEAVIERPITAWETPTDVLLEVLGDELLRTVPVLGTVDEALDPLLDSEPTSTLIRSRHA